jgi:hypothetical protein
MRAMLDHSPRRAIISSTLSAPRRNVARVLTFDFSLLTFNFQLLTF